MSKQVLRLAPGVNVEPIFEEFTLDCRLLFMGDRYRQLVRAYPEVVHRLSRSRPPPQIAAFIRDSAEIAQYYNLEVGADRVAVTLRDEMFRSSAPLDRLDCCLRLGHRGKRVDLPLPMERLQALGHLVPLLQGNHSEPEIRDGLTALTGDNNRAWAENVLATLLQHRLVETGPARPNYFLRSSHRPRVSLVAHTSILLQTPGATILTDPLLRPSLKAPREALDVARLGLTAICCTHAHWDHCDVQSLLLFDKRVPVIVPRVHKPTAFNPPIVPVLSRLGFTDIREVDPWDRIHLGDVEMLVVPFHGEQDEPGAEIDHFTYVFQTKGLSLYGGVDAFRDTFGEMPEVLARVKRECEPNVAFLPISRMTYQYGHGGVNGFCRYMDTTLLDKRFQYTAGPLEAVQWVRELGVSTVVPYAIFTFDRRATPAPVAEFVVEMNRERMGDRLLPLPALGAIEPADLDGSVRALRRRRALQRWFTVGARVSSLDRRLKQITAYRLARRLVAGRDGGVAQHH